MATLYGVNYTKAFNLQPQVKLNANVESGKVRVIYDEIDLVAALGAGDKIYFGKLPKGARVVEATLCFPDLGTTGAVDLGYEYEDSTLVSDDNAFLDDVDVATAADTVSMSDQANMVGFMQEMQGKAKIVLTAGVATTATSGKIRLLVQYVAE